MLTEKKKLVSDAIDDPNVSYTAAVVDADDSGSEHVPVETSDMVTQQHVALVTQEDGTQQQVIFYSNLTEIFCCLDYCASNHCESIDTQRWTDR